ncbi:hypothetical protein CRM22_009383 [Opisthorchis felineus]|uniref:Polysaccharide biosynthesis domain-containing protein n=1 Tax=Opisthorchis felineus TaxID=147828 RepID=A0A4S2L935_OPIFE|nr:hypothetical protein CRM22_009383 [Opisthorchis felineus]
MVDVDVKNYVNDPNIELQWAIRSYEHAETHFRLLCSVSDLAGLRLTRMDDQIYEEFGKVFPDLDVSILSEDQLKSPESKALWRDFCNKFSEELEDYNLATLFRLDASKAYDEHNTCVVPRIQFLALEIARNRRGDNKPEVLRQLQ